MKSIKLWKTFQGLKWNLFSKKTVKLIFQANANNFDSCWLFIRKSIFPSNLFLNKSKRNFIINLTVMKLKFCGFHSAVVFCCLMLYFLACNGMGNSIIHWSLFLKQMTQFAFALVNLSSFETWINFDFLFGNIWKWNFFSFFGIEAFSTRKFRNFHISDLSWAIKSLKITIRLSHHSKLTYYADQEIGKHQKYQKNCKLFFCFNERLTEKNCVTKRHSILPFSASSFWNDWIEKQLILLYSFY